MLVKCPKCRLGFEVTTTPGITAVQCNCPRCGTPFTYTVSADDADGAEHGHSAVETTAPQAADTVPTTAVPPPIPTGVRTSERPTPPRVDVLPTSAEPRVGASQPFSSPKPGSGRGNVVPAERKSSGCCLKIFLFTLALIFGLFFLIVRQCGGSSKSYSGDEVVSSNSLDSDVVTQKTAAAAYADMASADQSFDPHAPRERAPEWIQGSWFVNTEYEGITMTISGDRIAESSGGKTSYGKFYYQNNRLYSDFGDGSLFVYRLDPERRMIDAGSGLLMHKTDG